MFGELREHLGKSLAVRVFSMHSFDADPLLRCALMNSAIDQMARGAVRPAAATVLPLSDAREAHRRLDAPDFLGKIILRP